MFPLGIRLTALLTLFMCVWHQSRCYCAQITACYVIYELKRDYLRLRQETERQRRNRKRRKTTNTNHI